jgi:hypothetical protein
MSGVMGFKGASGGPETVSSSNPLPVTFSGSAAGDLGKAEDAAHASGDVGVMALAVQKATPADLGADGDYGPLQVSGGKLWTKASGPLVDDAAFGVATDSVFPMGAMADEVSPDSVNEGDIGVLRMTLDRLLKTAEQGAASCACGVVAASTAAATLVAARATRRRVTVKNRDGTITVYVGPATVTSSAGAEIKAGESKTFFVTGLLQVIAASATPSVEYVEEYD